MKVLIVYYSQTKQSQRIASILKQSFKNEEAELLEIKAKPPFSFPWKIGNFFAQMPECVEGRGCEIEDINEEAIHAAEAIVLVNPVWFLSPSLPIQAFLKLAFDKRFLESKKVFQVLTCRNMWAVAAKKTKQLLLNGGAHYSGFLAVSDPSPNWASLITTPRWMFWGKKEAFSIFPPAGISEDVFNDFEKKGTGIVANSLRGASEVLRLSSVEQRPEALSFCLERFGHFVLFKPWAKLILSSPEFLKSLLIFAFRLNLVLFLILIVPPAEVISRLIPQVFRFFAKREELKLRGDAA